MAIERGGSTVSQRPRSHRDLPSSERHTTQMPRLQNARRSLPPETPRANPAYRLASRSPQVAVRQRRFTSSPIHPTVMRSNSGDICRSIVPDQAPPWQAFHPGCQHSTPARRRRRAQTVRALGLRSHPFSQEFGKAKITSLVERVSRFAVFLRNNDRQSRPVMES